MNANPRYKIEDEIWHHSTKLVQNVQHHYDESDNLSHTFQHHVPMKKIKVPAKANADSLLLFFPLPVDRSQFNLSKMIYRS
jgi:hypothetical protein